MTLVYLSEEYGFRNYLWEAPMDLVELIKAHHNQEDVRQYYFSAIGYTAQFGGKVREIYMGESPLYGWGEFVAKDGYEEFSFEDCPAAFEPLPKDCRGVFIHLHDEDDSYLKVGEKVYLHRGWTGKDPI